MSNIRYNIVNGIAPFNVELVGSTLLPQIIINIGVHYLYNVPNGSYVLKITDSDGCVFEKNIVVDPTITTTTTTVLGSSIIVGNTISEVTVFYSNSTNRDFKYNGYPDSNIVDLYLWFKTADGKALNENIAFNYLITNKTLTLDSEFKFDFISDQIHMNVFEDTIGRSSTISGQIVLLPGFIESLFKYTFYKITDEGFKIELISTSNIFNTEIPTRFDDNVNYGIETLSSDEILLIF
jgi:hypothetical protein